MKKANSVTMPFTFGKDSLLTFGLLCELELHPDLIYFAEPTSKTETSQKKLIAERFSKVFHTKVQFVNNTLGAVRQKDNLMWGWDMLVTQYTLLLIPYLWFYQSKYFLWSHEQSVNSGDGIDHGFRVNVSHEQTTQWMLHLNNLLHEFGVTTQLGSILEPLQEISIMYILHKRYPELGKYQHSCLGDFNNSFNRRWCGDCYECVRVYLFLRAIAVDPHQIGFDKNLLDISRKKHFLIFEEKELKERDITFNRYSERMLAFYLTYKRGFRGGVVDLFEKYYLPIANNTFNKLAAFYTKLFPQLSVPPEIFKKIDPIYRKEMSDFYNEIMQIR